jgi:hypothetical protein
MDETPRAFTARTSIAYAPPAWLVFHAEPLGPEAVCPTLFRYPGPCGLADWFAGQMAVLGPPGPMLWLADRPVFSGTVGARHFGTLALLRPLGYKACPHRPRVWLAVNGPPDEVVWVPPSAVERRIPWSRLGTVAEARALLPEDERGAAIDSLALYLEELDGMRRSGAPGPGVPWLMVPVDERLRQLAAAGVRPVWTAAPGRRNVALPWA